MKMLLKWSTSVLLIDALNVNAGASLLSNMGIFLLVNNTLVSKQDVKWEDDLNALFIFAVNIVCPIQAHNACFLS